LDYRRYYLARSPRSYAGSAEDQKKNYAQLPAVGRRQAAQRAIKIRENIQKVLQDKKAGKSYRGQESTIIPRTKIATLVSRF
jgi:hypothetical protein